VHGVAEVGPVPQHRAGLLRVAVAPGVDHHRPGHPRGRGRPVPHRDQVQGQVDTAGDARRGDDPIVLDVQDVADHLGAGSAVRATTSSVCSVRGAARSSLTLRPGGAPRCGIGNVAVASVTKMT
jgi:hypothetical protein